MQRRSFLKRVVPIAAMVGVPVSVLGHEGRQVEVSPTKQYVFVFPESMPLERLNFLYAHLVSKGFKDPILYAGVDVEMYEVNSPA